MTGQSELIRQANELKHQAETESDKNIRDRLMRMAEHYDHLAESQASSEAHTPTIASLGELLTKKN